MESRISHEQCYKWEAKPNVGYHTKEKVCVYKHFIEKHIF